MSYSITSPVSDQEWQNYFQLRWEVLRAPWQQPPGSERDELEAEAFHLMAIDGDQYTVGVARIHRLTEDSSQIRYMAVHPQHQGKGIGSQLLEILEHQARVWCSKDILLNARTTCMAFYQKHQYEVIGEAPTLFGSIAHRRMRKLLV